MARRPFHPLAKDGRLIEGLLVSEREWPGLRTLWLWLRQGRPHDYPVIIREGTITAIARAVDEAGNPEIYAADVKIRGWRFSHSMLPAGGIDSRDLMRGLLARRGATVTFPDGHQETRWLKQDPDTEDIW